VSQRALARDAEISHTLLNRSESGSRIPADLDEVRRIARVLRLESVDLDRLLGAAGYWPSAFLTLGPHDSTLRAVAEALARVDVSPQVRAELRRALEATIAAVMTERSSPLSNQPA
jgi:hypothetical protein